MLCNVCEMVTGLLGMLELGGVFTGGENLIIFKNLTLIYLMVQCYFSF